MNLFVESLSRIVLPVFFNKLFLVTSSHTPVCPIRIADAPSDASATYLSACLMLLEAELHAKAEVVEV